jgi:hypothetical protein
MLGSPGLRYYRLAEDLVARGEWGQAQAQLDRALRSSPWDPLYQSLRLFVRWRLGEVPHREAIERLGAVGAGGGRAGAQALHLLGSIYLARASPSAAEDCFWLAHQHHPRRGSSACAIALDLTGWGWDLVDHDDFIETACEGAMAA